MKEKMTIILFSGNLDKAIAAFILATTAASTNMDVSIFFTFWGLNIIKKNRFAVKKSQNILQKIFNILSTKFLPLSRMNMLGLGPLAMKILMKKTKMANLEELIGLAKQLGVKFIVCTTSCGVLGLSKEDFIDKVDDFVGAAAYLAEGKNSKINLFI
jgi:peroxiredoxin family protein